MKYFHLIGIILLAFTSCSSSDKEYSLGNVNVIEGAEVSALIKQKQYSAIYFWTTWCAPCRSTLKRTIKPILDTINRDDFQVLVVALSKQPEKVKEIIDATGVTQDVYVVKDYTFDNALADKMKMNNIISKIDDEIGFINSVPAVLMVDKNNVVYGKEHSVIDLYNFLNGKLIQ